MAARHPPCRALKPKIEHRAWDTIPQRHAARGRESARSSYLISCSGRQSVGAGIWSPATVTDLTTNTRALWVSPLDSSSVFRRVGTQRSAVNALNKRDQSAQSGGLVSAAWIIET